MEPRGSLVLFRHICFEVFALISTTEFFHWHTVAQLHQSAWTIDKEWIWLKCVKIKSSKYEYAYIKGSSTWLFFLAMFFTPSQSHTAKSCVTRFRIERSDYSDILIVIYCKQTEVLTLTFLVYTQGNIKHKYIIVFSQLSSLRIIYGIPVIYRKTSYISRTLVGN